MKLKFILPLALAVSSTACNDPQKTADIQSSATAVDVDPDMPDPPPEPSAPPDATPQPIPGPPDARPQR